MKIVKNSEARLVINLRLYKNAGKKNVAQKMRNGRMQSYSTFKIFNCAFFEHNDSLIFVKLVTFLNVLA